MAKTTMKATIAPMTCGSAVPVGVPKAKNTSAAARRPITSARAMFMSLQNRIDPRKAPTSARTRPPMYPFKSAYPAMNPRTPPRIMPMRAMILFQIPRPQNAKASPRTTNAAPTATAMVGSRAGSCGVGITGESFCSEYKNPSKGTPAQGTSPPVFITDQLFYEATPRFPRHGGGIEVHNGAGAEDDLDIAGGGLRIRDRLALERGRHERADVRGHQYDSSQGCGRVGDLRGDSSRPDRRDGGPHHPRGPPRPERILGRRGERSSRGEVLLSPAGHRLRSLKVVALDGYVDGSPNLGVPGKATVRGPMRAVRGMHHHCTRYSQWSSPDRAHRVLVTVPATPRAFRIPS